MTSFRKFVQFKYDYFKYDYFKYDYFKYDYFKYDYSKPKTSLWCKILLKDKSY